MKSGRRTSPGSRIASPSPSPSDHCWRHPRVGNGASVSVGQDAGSRPAGRVRPSPAPPGGSCRYHAGVLAAGDIPQHQGKGRSSRRSASPAMPSVRTRVLSGSPAPGTTPTLRPSRSHCRQTWAMSRPTASTMNGISSTATVSGSKRHMAVAVAPFLVAFTEASPHRLHVVPGWRWSRPAPMTLARPSPLHGCSGVRFTVTPPAWVRIAHGRGLAGSRLPGDERGGGAFPAPVVLSRPLRPAPVRTP